jgi:hypothetical protein
LLLGWLDLVNQQFNRVNIINIFLVLDQRIGGRLSGRLEPRIRSRWNNHLWRQSPDLHVSGQRY